MKTLELYIFESADAGCAGRCLEQALKFIRPHWLKIKLTSKPSGGGYDVVAYWDLTLNGDPQPGPAATFESELWRAQAFAAGFKAGMGVR